MRDLDELPTVTFVYSVETEVTGSRGSFAGDTHRVTMTAIQHWNDAFSKYYACSVAYVMTQRGLKAKMA